MVLNEPYKTITLYILNHMKLLQSNVVQPKTKCYSPIWFIQNQTLHSNVVHSKPMCIVLCLTPLYNLMKFKNLFGFWKIRFDIHRLSRNINAIDSSSKTIYFINNIWMSNFFQHVYNYLIIYFNISIKPTWINSVGSQTVLYFK